MSARRLYLDIGPGETRGVVTLDGRPERLLIDRGRRGPRSGRWRGAIDRPGSAPQGSTEASNSAFLDLGGGGEAVLALTGAAGSLAEGAAVEIEVMAEARRGKGAVARLIGPAAGEPRAISPPQSIEARLGAFAPDRAIIRGLEARLVADEAEAEALASEHPLTGGGSLAIEPTRALVAVDVRTIWPGGGVRRCPAGGPAGQSGGDRRDGAPAAAEIVGRADRYRPDR